MAIIREDLGKLIKDARRIKSEKVGKRYTQSMMAWDIDRSHPYIDDLESGRTYPSFMVLSRIAKACDVPLSFFEVTYAVYEGKNKNDSEITDIKSAMDNIMSQPSLMLNGEPVSEHIRTSLTAAVNMWLQHAEELQKKDKRLYDSIR